MRITIPDLMSLAQDQTYGLIKKADWFPVSTANTFSRLVGNMKGTQFVDFSTHAPVAWPHTSSSSMAR